jgi:hypothetical protein
MRALHDLLRTVRGRSFLEARAVFTDPDSFRASLGPPSHDGLKRLLGLESGSPLVYVGQQVCCDYPDSVARKLVTARDLGLANGVATAVLWHDMDRAGSEDLGMRIVLPLGRDRTSIRVAPRPLREREPRFIEVGGADVEEALRRIAAWIGQGVCKERRAGARAKLSRLSEALGGAGIDTLADFNHALASCLLREQLTFEAPSAFVSRVARSRLLTSTIGDLLACIDDFIAVVNEAIEELVAFEVDPQLHPLPPDYLPLRYSCPRDGSRLRLTRVTGARDRFAVGKCHCGIAYRFPLGGSSDSFGELEATGRWSPDISLPIYLNDLASGVVAGRSSALYGLVLNEGLRRVLGRQPIPALVPAEPAETEAPRNPRGSLLYEYLTG